MTPSPDNLNTQTKQSLDAFIRWLDKNGYDSFDPYDLWGTRYGLWARKVYYDNKWLGTPLVAPIVATDIVLPSVRKAFLAKRRYATADAQLVLGFVNLFETTSHPAYLKRAESLTSEFLEYAVTGYRGLCWGYPFDWQNNKAMWPKNTPYITCTPYCYEAFIRLYETTGNNDYLTHARSVSRFIYQNLNETPFSEDAAAGSYSPLDNSMVVNASAYRAYTLIDAGKRFQEEEQFQAGLRNLRFVQQSQNENGSWLYGLDTPADRFVDHFHTCFNLKNLIKLNKRLLDESVKRSIRKGYDWYLANLFHQNGRPKSFAKVPRLQIAKLEMYNYAEAITLGCLARDLIPGSFEKAKNLANDLIENFQLSDGHFATRTLAFGRKHTFPFIRWPQAQIFLALTNLSKTLSSNTERDSATQGQLSQTHQL